MDLFISTPYYLNFNPNITVNHYKSLDINNPTYIYICTNSYDFFLIIAILILLIIIYICNYIVNHPNIIRWFAQNLLLNILN
jgi:hypothetical protein